MRSVSTRLTGSTTEEHVCIQKSFLELDRRYAASAVVKHGIEGARERYLGRRRVSAWTGCQPPRIGEARDARPCRTHRQAEQALALVEQVLTELGLSLSPEKTKITTYWKGYEFLGFHLSSRSRRMRPKSVEKLKTKIRGLTRRLHNLDATLLPLARLPQVQYTHRYSDFSDCTTERRKILPNAAGQPMNPMYPCYSLPDR